ncbi:hypothetical protein M9458_033272 [Cirrhinus mrigala]|uniref:Gypsy retrotransposon integrase-like protein 1 n=1 Tax=Cirrhinus mrigala TaxID=683832 RepID=A0ABD0PH14_CIRMR
MSQNHLAPPSISPRSHLFAHCHLITNYTHLCVTTIIHKEHTHLHSSSGLVCDHTLIFPAGLSARQNITYLRRLRPGVPSSSIVLDPLLYRSSATLRKVDYHLTEDRTVMANKDLICEFADLMKEALTKHTPVTAPLLPHATGIASPMATPVPYSGSAEDCNGFLLQCSLKFEMEPHRFPTERGKIAFFISLLQGPALRWAESYINQPGVPPLTADSLIKYFRIVFGKPIEDSSVCDALLHLRQGKMSVQEYALKFRTLAASSGWNERALITVFRNGLNPTLRLQLACINDDIGLEKLIQTSVSTADRMNICFPPSKHTFLPRQPESGCPEPEPMQINTTRITQQERQCRLTQGLCLYCGSSGHDIIGCPIRPSRSSVSKINAPMPNCSPLTSMVNISVPYCSVTVNAILDSGSAGNFMSAQLCEELKLQKLNISKAFQAHSITGKPLNKSSIRHQTSPCTMTIGILHHEETAFLVLDNSTADVILRRPWLIQHHPELSWDSGEIRKWSTTCFRNCFPQLPLTKTQSTVLPVCTTIIESPKEKVSMQIPVEYSSFADVFCPKRASQLPPHRPWDCAIDLLPDAPVPKVRIYPLLLPEQQAMEEYVQEALAQGYIRPSTSPAASPFFFVAKKDGGLRPCIDYRALNQVTVKFSYPLPLVPSALEQLCGAQIYSKLDLRSAYNLVRIRRGDEWKTAFITPSGHYEYLNFMNTIFQEYLNRFVIVYIDDILIYSPSLSEHIGHVKLVLQKLREFTLLLKAEKCKFHVTHTSFLGYIISPTGVCMDERKVVAISSWPTPTTVKELQRFLGFSNFYRRFIKNYSQVVSPLTSLLKNKPKKLTWPETADQAFLLLKQLFTQAPILIHPNPDLPFTVEVDASSTGVGAVLSQQPENHPCAFSRKFNPAEANYDIGNRELLAVKLALEEWRHWLEGAWHPFTVLTDHKNLQYLREAKRMNSRQARWALFFTRFNFTITYRPGERNVQADALSRLHAPPEEEETPDTILPGYMFVSPIQWTDADPPTEAPPGCPPDRQTISQVHSSLSTGHPGSNQTLSLVSNKYWWPNMAQDVRRFVRGCADCAMAKTPRHLPTGKLLPLPVPRRPWSHLGVDFATDLPNSRGVTCILIIVDRFSKSVHFIPLKGLPTAMETAELLFNHVFRYFGIPEDIVSDRGPQFISRVWRAFFKLLGVTVSLSSGYHPQSNGLMERKIQDLSRFLRIFCHKHQDTWSRFLPWAEYAQNSLKQQATGLTPFQCVLGYQPPMLPWSEEPSDLPSVDFWFQVSERVWDHHLQEAVRRFTQHTNTRRTSAPRYTSGQKVWLSTKNIRLRLPCKKQSPRFIGPFEIIKEINPVAYELKLPEKYRIHPVFHVSALKPYHPPVLSPSSTEPVEEGIYRVREILDSRRRGGALQYLVDWEDFGPEERWLLGMTSWTRIYSWNFTPPRSRGSPPRRKKTTRPSGADRGGGAVLSLNHLAPPSISPRSHLFAHCHLITNYTHLCITTTIHKEHTHLHSSSGLICVHTLIFPAGLSARQNITYLRRLRPGVPSSSIVLDPLLYRSSATLRWTKVDYQ